MANEDWIDHANKLPLTRFISCFMPLFAAAKGAEDQPYLSKYYNSKHCKLFVETAATMSKDDLNACFNLVKTTSSEDYKKSKGGWKPKSKMKEMKLLDLKYILVKEYEKEGVIGFISFMPTYEDDYPVIYCYEIHLEDEYRGIGLGESLMDMLNDVGQQIPGISKLMMTCFTFNERAMRFYKKLGYIKDEYSPPPKLLRNGTVVEEPYVILSKKVDRVPVDHGVDLE